MSTKPLRRTLAVLLAMTMLFALLPAVHAADDYSGWTSFTADFSQPAHEIRHMAMGCLYGLGEEDIPTSNLLTPIRPYTFEQKAPDGLQHPNGDAVLTAKTFLESGGKWIEVGCPDIKANWYYEESPFQSEANYALYKRQLREMAEKCVEAGLSGYCVYNIFNETDDGSNTWNVSNSVWFAAWKDFVETIRAVDPKARFSGPGFANHKMDFLREWIPWCIENDCAPFQVTLHCLTDGRYNTMDSDIPLVRSICEEAGLTDFEICANEYAHHQNLGNPAGLIKYVAALEDNQASGCLAFWHVGNALDDLAADANEPNGAWWLYKMYADMSGTTVKCSTSTSKMNLYGLATIDESKKTATALFGGDHAGNEVLYMKGLDKTEAFKNAKYALVTLRSTTYTGTYGPYAEPDLVFRRVLPIENGQIAVPAEGALATNVFCATAIPVEKESDPAEVEGGWRTVLEAESAQRSGGSVVSSNTNYPASGGSLVSLPNTGSSLTFTLTAPKDSYYELRIVYGMDTGSSPSNMNNHNPKMGKLDIVIDGNEDEKITMALDNTLQQLTCDNLIVDPNTWLDAGTHTIKLRPSADSAGFPIIDCLQVTQRSYYSFLSAERVYEAEEATFNALAGLKSSPIRISREKEGFEGPGYVTGLSAKVYNGAGLRFVVCTDDCGYHSINLRYACPTDAKLGLYLRNTALSLYNKVLDVSLEASEDWTTYSPMLYLEKGVNIIDIDASTDELMLDNIMVSPNAGASFRTTIVQAESCETAGAVQTAESEFASGGVYVRGMAGSADAANKLTLKVTPSLYGFLPLGAGKYQLDIYYSDNELFGNHGTNVAMVDRALTMSVNGGRPKTLYFRNTYSGDCFRVKTVVVELQAGENVLEFWNDDQREYRRSQGGTILLKNYAPNLDRFQLTPIAMTMTFEDHEHETVLRDYKAPTCTGPGFSGDQVCKLCGATVAYGEEIPATGHTLIHHEAQAPGCVVEGWKAYDSCANCSYTTYEAVDPVGHDWDDGRITTAPTETAPGVMTFTCKRCGETKTKRVPRVGATVPDDIDFTDPGSADQFSIVNNTNNNAIISGTGLTLTCTRPAFEDCKGQNSGDQATVPEEVVLVPVEGDWAANLAFDFDPSGASNGYYQFFGFYAAQGEDYQNLVGVRCGDGALQNFERHNGEITHQDEDAVNSSPGLNTAKTYYLRIEKEGDTYTCFRSDNGEDWTEMFAYADSGVEADHLVIDAYTGMTTGYKCTLKSLTFEDMGGGTPACEHEYVPVVTAPTCTEAGYTTYTCSKCGSSYVADAVPVLGHDYQAVVTAPTCTEKGHTTYTCSRCGDSYVGDEVSALGHDYQTVVTAPTCTEAGFTTYTCSRCGFSYNADEVAKLDHDYKDGVCTRCGAADPDYVPPFRFDDVKDSSQYYFDPVYWAVDKGITTGSTPTTFNPGAGCTRAQVVTFLWRAAGKPEPTTTTNPFEDVAADQYYYKAVLWAVEKGITQGTSPTTFRPDNTCTRGQIVTFLWRYSGQPEPEKADNPFADVPAGEYYYKPVLWAVEKGITKGTSETKFSPDSTCTRAQIVTFLYRA
ncbi:MAG: S-layer homology domain-containing protein, partial [Oscillospiraceae bacterium]|nr:S-layer homology domain-containing protein [Oscillospiraceae bacterium]